MISALVVSFIIAIIIALLPSQVGTHDRQLAIDAVKWNTDTKHNGAVCDTNAAAAVGEDGVSVVGVWRHCETDHLHTVPHTVTAPNGSDPSAYVPNVLTTFPFMAHAGAVQSIISTFYY
jgi:hypothetical protein